MNKFKEGDYAKINHKHGSIGKITQVKEAIPDYYYIEFVYGLDVNGNLMKSTAGVNGYDLIHITEKEYLEVIKPRMPKIICFCGSTKFTNEMLIIKWEYEKKGIIVLTWNYLPGEYLTELKLSQMSHLAEQENVKEILDELHKRKIDLADEVFVLNVDGYIGESTKSEIIYAYKANKIVKFLEPDKVDKTQMFCDVIGDVPAKCIESRTYFGDEKINTHAENVGEIKRIYFKNNTEINCSESDNDEIKLPSIKLLENLE